MSFLASIPLLGRLLGAASAPPAVRLGPVAVHAVETDPEKRPRTLKHLLRGNHVNHALLLDGTDGSGGSGGSGGSDGFNDMAHALCAAYLLGASADHLNRIYDAIAPRLAAWQPSPAEIADVDWHDFLGDAAYQRAYVDFFEDVLAEHAVAYNWKHVVEMYLLGRGRDEDSDFAYGDDEGGGAARSPPSPLPPPPPHGLLVDGLVSGLGHPLVHLAYAYEMDSRVLAMEALGTAAVAYNARLQRLLDDPAVRARPVPDGLRGLPLVDLLSRLARDSRFDGVPAGVPAGATANKVEAVLVDAPPAVETALVEYWNAWDLTGAGTGGSLDHRLHEAQQAAVALLVATVAPGTHKFSLCLSQVVATSHAVRVLLPNIPARFHVAVLRQWWLLALAAYVAVGRPAVDLGSLPTDRQGKGWMHVEQQALTSPGSTDAHYVQTIRAMSEATRTWADVDELFLNAAVRFVDDFEEWTQ